MNAIGPKILYDAALHPTGPLLVLKPGHMFVGYYLDEAHRQFEFRDYDARGRTAPHFHRSLRAVSRERIMAAVCAGLTIRNKRLQRVWGLCNGCAMNL